MTRGQWCDLLSKFPVYDPGWPDDVRAKWFSTFRDLWEIAVRQQREEEQ